MVITVKQLRKKTKANLYYFIIFINNNIFLN